MGKSKKEKAYKKRKQNTSSDTQYRDSTGAKLVEAKSMVDYLAAMPGFLMCLVIALILILDVSMPDMLNKQYQEFQSLFKVINAAVAVFGALFIIYKIYKHSWDRKKQSVSIYQLFLHPYTSFAIFILCMLISTCVNGFTQEAMHGLPYRDIGVVLTIEFVIIYMGVTGMQSRNTFNHSILLTFLFISACTSLAAIYDRYVDKIPAFQGKKELSTIFFNGNHYGYFLAMAILIGVGYYLHSTNWQVYAGAIIAALDMFVLALNHSLGSILAVAFVMIIASAVLLRESGKYKKRLMLMWLAILIMSISAAALSPDIRREFSIFAGDMLKILNNRADGSVGHNRLKVWRLTAQYILARPLTGYGCEGISYQLYSALGISNPHNEILTYAAYYGIPSAVFYAGGVLGVVAGHIRRPVYTETGRIACMAAAGYFIASITGVAMFYTTPFFFIFMGVTMSGRKARED